MLTSAQIATLRAIVLAEPTLASARTNGDDGAIAAWLNADTTFRVWKTSIQPSEYRSAITWTEVDALTVGKARIWEWLTAAMTLPVSPADTNVRQGIADAFGVGTTTRANLLALGKRSATKAESVLASGTGSDASPGTLVFEGQVTPNEASLMR